MRLLYPGGVWFIQVCFHILSLAVCLAHRFVPWRIHDHLLTRLSNDDDLEKNLSTFANEMASIAMILGTFALCDAHAFLT